MKKDEALRLAEEALVYHTEQTRPIHKTNEAIAAIRAALVDAVDTSEECVDETVECGHEPVDNKDWQKVSYIRERLDKEVEEFTKEQQDRFATAFDEAFAKMGLPQKQEVEPVKQEPVAWIDPKDLEVLLKLKENYQSDTICGYQMGKDAPDPKDRGVPLYAAPVEPVKQGPVAEVRVRPLQGNESTPRIDVEWLVRPTPGFLYAAPQPSLDVDLTDDDYDALLKKCRIFRHQAEAVIAKYKDKNK